MSDTGAGRPPYRVKSISPKEARGNVHSQAEIELQNLKLQLRVARLKGRQIKIDRRSGKGETPLEFTTGEAAYK